MAREIKLSGGEISFLKAMGLSGTPINGELLLERVEMEDAEFLDVLEGLISSGYVTSTKVNVMKIEDVERSYFRVNASYSRDLRDAMRPTRRKDKDREQRRRRRS
jgi:hypothetical protein